MERKRIALLFVCLNPPYWPFMRQVVEDAQQFFLKNHQVDFFAWTDFSEESLQKEIDYKLFPLQKAVETLPANASLEVIGKAIADILDHFCDVMETIGRQNADVANVEMQRLLAYHGIGIKRDQGQPPMASFTKPITAKSLKALLDTATVALNHVYGSVRDIVPYVKVIETDPVEWPAPTLMRYHLFLNEESLKDYDYVFYMDVDMRIVGEIGEEILGQGLTMAEHPMYAVDKKFVPPYEPNKDSAAYIKRFGIVVPTEGGGRWYKPLYAAGGFQGGTSKDFIEAMKVMKSNIDKDFINNYVAIWNDESHWNKYLSDYQGHLTVLTPSFVYPDSLIKEYYEHIWGRSYVPKVVTLTKHFSLSKEAGQVVSKHLEDMSKLK